MSDALNIQGAMLSAKNAPVGRPHPTNDPQATKKVAAQFEGILVTQFLNQMFEGISTDGMFGGGKGEEVFRGMLLQEYGKLMAQTSSIGLADQVKQQIILMQAQADNGTQNAN